MDDFFQSSIDDQLREMFKQGEKRRVESVQIKATMGLLPDFLPLGDIGILSGFDGYAFEEVIKRIGLVTSEQDISHDAGGNYHALGAFKSDYKVFLQSTNQWPFDGLLANWWNDEPQAEPMADAGAVSHAGTEPTRLNQSSNDLKFSGLLNEPAKKDDWFSVIDDMTKAFFTEYGKLPNDTQAWGRLSTVELAGYVITTGNEKGEVCLNMPGAKALSRSAFSKRWVNYTTNKPR